MKKHRYKTTRNRVLFQSILIFCYWPGETQNKYNAVSGKEVKGMGFEEL
jgi:hypothetical protein